MAKRASKQRKSRFVPTYLSDEVAPMFIVPRIVDEMDNKSIYVERILSLRAVKGGTAYYMEKRVK